MKQLQIAFGSIEDFRQKLESFQCELTGNSGGAVSFYITWTRSAAGALDLVTREIERVFPEAPYYGCEASGNISMGRLIYGVHVTCTAFEAPDSGTELIWVQKGTETDSLEALWRRCADVRNLRAVELIPSIAYLDTLKIEKNTVGLPGDIPVFGGASVNYDDATFMADVIAKGHPRTREGMAVLLYTGGSLRFSTASVLGWKGLGSLMEVTGSTGKRITEIGHEPAFSIYEKYLNLTLEDNDALLFPLLVNEDGTDFIRTPQIYLNDRSMQMFADVPEGSMVRIAYGDKNGILDSIYGKAEEIAAFRPQAIRAYSCAARRLFWGDGEISRETEILQELAPTCGFYTGGEILRFGDRLRVMNQTLSLVSVREDGTDGSDQSVRLPARKPDTSLVSRLAYFAAQAVAEQETALEQVREQQDRLTENMEIIGGLAGEYLALYYINLKDRRFRVCTLDSQRLADTERLLTQDTDAFALIRMFAQSAAVHPDDRILFDVITPEGVRDVLADTKKYSIRFRRNYGEGFLWSVMDIIKYEAAEEEPNSIAIGFAERDRQIRREMEMAEAEEARKVIDGIVRNYTTAYIADLAKDTYQILKSRESTDLSREMTGSFSYSVRSYAKNSVCDTDRAFFVDQMRFETIRRRLKETQTYTFEYRTVEDSEILWNEMSVTALSGDEVLFATAARDSEILTRRILNRLSSSFEGIYVADLSRNRMKILKGTGGFAKYEGMTLPIRDTMRQFASTLEGEYREFFRDIYGDPDVVREFLKRDEDIEYYYQSPYFGSEPHWMKSEIHTLTWDGNGEPETAMVGISQVDSQQREKMRMNAQIAEQKEQLRQALDMARSANKAKTDFLFNMSHDIRTPMNAVLGFTAMAKKHIDEREKVLDCLEKTQQSGSLLLALINSVLDVSRIESGQARLEESPADVTLSFAAVKDTLTELAEARDIDLTFEYGEIRDRFVYCDLNRCNRVFVNIISNAVKYTHAGGFVRVRCEQTDNGQDECGLYRYTFTDNGIGMSEEFQKRVFDQFARERSTTVSGIQGSGLGLAVCKSFTELMGGTIECKSCLGEGTTFTVTLPFRIQKTGHQYVDPYTREEVNAGDAGFHELPSVTLRGKRVLLVEDNELNMEIAEELLTEEGLDVETAEDGSEAVEKLRVKGPEYYDFILMDIQMPVMNGYEATRAIRAMYPGTKLPIIAVSANAFEEDRRASREAGMDDHVAKPINVGDLFTVLGRCTD